MDNPPKILEALATADGEGDTRVHPAHDPPTDEPLYMKYQQKLIRLCSKKGWDQADLMRAVRSASPDAKASRQTVSNWFSGRTKPDISTGLWVARTLGVSLDYLADDTLDEPPKPEGELTELQRRILWLVGQMGEKEALARLVAIPGKFAGVTQARPEPPREPDGGDGGR